MNSTIIKLSIFCLLFFNKLNSQNLVTVGAHKPIIKEISDTLELPGSVVANESVKITSVVSEKIKRILFKEGRFVKKNQLLVELIDNEEQALLMQVQAELEEAQVNYERALILSKKGNISQSILDNRLMTKKKLSGKVKEIKAQIEDLKIKAPFNGLTGIRNFSEGSFIKPGDVITELYDTEFLKIQAYVPESYSDQVKVNSNFILDLSSKKIEEINGKISVVNPIVDENTRTFKILGRINNSKNNIMPGMMVNLKIPLAKRNAFIVRENAILSQDNLSFVYVIIDQNIVSKKKIEVGFRNDGMVEVLNGLNSDDLVVFEGINKIKEGSKVKIR